MSMFDTSSQYSMLSLAANTAKGATFFILSRVVSKLELRAENFIVEAATNAAKIAISEIATQTNNYFYHEDIAPLGVDATTQISYPE